MAAVPSTASSPNPFLPERHYPCTLRRVSIYGRLGRNRTTDRVFYSCRVAMRPGYLPGNTPARSLENATGARRVPVTADRLALHPPAPFPHRAGKVSLGA